jgi:hypothetical protein
MVLTFGIDDSGDREDIVGRLFAEHAGNGPVANAASIQLVFRFATI